MSTIVSILDSGALQQLQLCLAFWQIVKWTPVGEFIKGIIACLLLPLIRWLQPFGLSPTIARLQCFHGRLFKRVRCHVIGAPKPMAPPACRQIDDQLNKLPSQYLGKTFVLERKEGNRLLVNGIMCYYITDAIWASLLDMAQKAPFTVFLNAYAKVWERTVAGRVMSLEQVLDSLILENQSMNALDNAWLLPVKLSESDDPLLSILNLVGIILQIYNVYFIPSLLSIISGVLEFIAPLRKWLYGKINIIFCCAIHLICDQLPYSVRRRVYVFGCWVENLKPSNDIKLKVVRNDTIYAVIAGGAKAYKEDATLVQGWSQFLGQVDEAAASVPISMALVPYVGYQFSHNEEKTFRCAHIDIKCTRRFGRIDSHDDYYIEASSDGVVIIDFVIKSRTRDDFLKMCTFLSCISQNRSGSLKCQPSDNKLCVRTLRESIMCYVRNGYPPVYILEFQNATVL